MITTFSTNIIFVLLFVVTRGLVINNKEQTAYNTPTVTWLSQNSWPRTNNVSGPVMSLTHANCCTGGIVYVTTDHYTWGYDIAEAHDRGAVGVIIFLDYYEEPGQREFYRINWNQAPKDMAPIPTVEAGPDFEELMQLFETNGSTFSVTLFPNEYNAWAKLNKIGFGFFSAFFGFLCLVTILLALYKLYILFKEYGCVCNIAQTCLMIEVIANAGRFVYVTVDPHFSRRIFSRLVGMIGITGFFSLSLATSLFIAFYWLEIIETKTVKVVGRLRSFLIPCIILVVLTIVSELAVSLALGLSTADLVFNLMYGVYSIMALAISLYLIVMGTLVLIRINKMATKNPRNKMIQQITVQIMLSGVFTILFVFSVLCTMASFFRYPVPYCVLWTIIWIFLLATSIAQITAIKKKKKSSKVVVQKETKQSDFKIQLAGISTVSSITNARDDSSSSMA